MTVMAGAGAPSVFLSDYQERWSFPTSDLSVAFAVYALVLVVVLLVSGPLSDMIGRRWSALGALAVTVVAMFVFLNAQSVGALIVARAVQGAGTAIATTVFSASIGELAPIAWRRLAELIVAITTAGGLGIGVVIAGAARGSSTHPETLVFKAVVVVAALASIAIAIGPETAPKHLPGTTRPQARVRGGNTTGLMRLAPGLIAIWMSAGLVLGLGASLAGSTLHLGHGLAAALVVAAQPLTAAVCTIIIAPRVASRMLVPGGLVSVIVGVASEATAFASGNALLEVLGAVITGLGFGAVFSGTLRTLLPTIAATDKARFFATFYLTGYLAYGASAIAAGILSDRIGLEATAIAYAAATIVIAAAALATGARTNTATAQVTSSTNPEGTRS
jgi:hypothetical protein